MKRRKIDWDVDVGAALMEFFEINEFEILMRPGPVPSDERLRLRLDMGLHPRHSWALTLESADYPRIYGQARAFDGEYDAAEFKSFCQAGRDVLLRKLRNRGGNI